MSCNHTADRRLVLDTLLIMEIYKWNLKYPSHFCYDDVYNQTDITSRALKNTENYTHQPFARTNSNRGFYWWGVAASQLLNVWDYIVVSSLCGHISLSQSHLNANCGSPRPIELEVSPPKPDTWAEGGGPNNRLLEKPSLKEGSSWGPNWIINISTLYHDSCHTDPILTFHQTRRKLVKQLCVCVASAYMFIFVEKSNSSCIVIF